MVRRQTAMSLAAFVIVGIFFSAAQAENRTFTFTAERKQVSIGSGLSYMAWTYDGTVPGPTIRVRQDDQVNIRLLNHTEDAHGIEILGAQVEHREEARVGEQDAFAMHEHRVVHGLDQPLKQLFAIQQSRTALFEVVQQCIDGGAELAQACRFGLKSDAARRAVAGEA